MPDNLGNAVLIVGVLYLHLLHGLDELITIVLVLIGLATWRFSTLAENLEKNRVNVVLDEAAKVLAELRRYLEERRRNEKRVVDLIEGV